MNALTPSHITRSLITSGFSLGRRNPRGEATGMSSRELSLEHPSNEDAMTYRQFFAARWRDFIRESYTCPAEVALVFRVDPSTAANWFEGLNAPQGWVVARVMTDPEISKQASKHLAGVGQCESYAAE